MNKVVVLLLCGTSLAWRPAWATDPPRGTLLELHSCELYAGGCTVSSEAPQGGRYMLRAWNFTDGNVDGVSFAGLKFALLQTSGDNLAAPDSTTGPAVLYLPDEATGAQRRALVAWLKSNQPDFREALTQTRIVALSLESGKQMCEFSAGSYLTVKAVSLDSCSAGSCGEALWYSPRSDNSVFTVAVNQHSKVAEPLLKLRWEDAGKRSVFLARFGEKPGPNGLYVSLTDLCGPAGRLF